MQRSIDAIVNATRLPLSIIIVSVGDANFDNMEILDADDNPLRHSETHKYMERDIVQFVPFNEFKTKHISAIACETLEEVPRQVTSFMAMHNLHPNPMPIEHSGQGINDANLYSNVNENNNNNNIVIDDEKKTDNYNIAPTAPTAPMFGFVDERYTFIEDKVSRNHLKIMPKRDQSIVSNPS